MNITKVTIFFLLDSGSIKPEELFQYSANKAKFATDKNYKKKLFKEAIEQLELELEGGVIAVNRESIEDVSLLLYLCACILSELFWFIF